MFPTFQRLGGPALAAVQALAALVAIALSLRFSDDTLCALINAGLFLLPFLLWSALSGRMTQGLAFATAFTLLVWAVGEFKLRYFGNRLALIDLYFISEGANWSIVKRYPMVQAALAAWLALCLLLLLWARRAQAAVLGWRGRALCTTLLAGWCALAWSSRHQHQWEVFRDDADCGPAKTCGVMSRLVYSYNVFEFAEPLPGGDPQPFLQAMAALPAAPPAAPAPRPDVVVWLHESTLDPAAYRLDGARLPKLGMFRSDPRNRAAGLLRVHTFGGKTWLSEFSLLTGLVPEDFGGRRTTVFNSVAPQLRDNLVTRFEANGYDSVVLMPTMPHFYGAARTYAGVGFDRVLTLRNFPEYDHIPGDEWDIADSERMGEAAARLLREHRRDHPERPLFLYLLSVKEHAPYSKRMKPDYRLERSDIPKSLASKLTDYIGKLRRLDAGLQILEKELDQPGHPALWAFFGDHQAYFEEDSPPYRTKLPNPDLLTQYRLRANGPTALVESPPLLDIALLPSLITDHAGLEANPYFQAQSAMRRLCQGRLEDCPDAALLASYKAHVFSPQLALFAPVESLAELK
ncbi:MAG TPA: sulfatase-like hydrolase/transferase [Solimonas sp.]|nr:sulfatase-like hydrolase/transferase [Solimonas sp.]